MNTGKGWARSVERSLRAYRKSVNDQAPFLGYFGASFWSAWILATSGIQDWLGASTGSSFSFAQTYTATRVILIAALVVCAALGTRAERALAGRQSTLVAGVAAALGNGMLVVAWQGGPAYDIVSLPGALLSGAGMALILLHAGRLYSRLSPWRALLLFMSSQLIAAVVYLVMTVAPPSAALVLFFALPLCATALFALVPSVLDSAADDDASRRSLGGALARFVFMIFVFRFCSNFVKTLLAALQPIDAVETGVTVNILLKMLIALSLIAYAFNASKKVDFGRVCYFLFVGTTALLVALPLFESQGTLLYALNGALSGLAGNIAFCMFASICFKSQSSPLRVFGIGYGAVLLGSLTGFTLGGQVGASLDPGQLPAVPFVVGAYALLLLALIVSPPRQFDRLMTAGPARDVLDELRGEAAPSESEQLRVRCATIARERGLTDREAEVLELLARGHGRRYVAERLQVSLNTVRSHARSIYGKLEVHSHSELVALLEGVDPTDGTTNL